jgi:hypothetical protein
MPLWGKLFGAEGTEKDSVPSKTVRKRQEHEEMENRAVDKGKGLPV